MSPKIQKVLAAAGFTAESNEDCQKLKGKSIEVKDSEGSKQSILITSASFHRNNLVISAFSCPSFYHPGLVGVQIEGNGKVIMHTTQKIGNVGGLSFDATEVKDSNPFKITD